MDEDIQELFSRDLTDVDISRPLLQPGLVALTVSECQVKPTKSGDKKMLVVTFKTRYEADSTKGGKIKPGFTVIDRITLTPTDDRPIDRVTEDLKRFQLACGRKGSFGQPSDYIGSQLTATVSVEVNSGGQYGDQNRVRYITAKV